MILEIIVIITVSITGSTCAGIDSQTNKAVYGSIGSPLVSTTYSDNGRIVYDTAPGPLNNAARLALHNAERVLQDGPTGPKVRVACIG